MKLQRDKLEGTLLILALIACAWGAIGLIAPSLLPSHVSVINLAALGLLLALYISGNGSRAVIRLAVIAMCFGVECAAFFTHSRLFYPIPAILAAVFSVSAIYAAILKHSKRKTEGGLLAGGPGHDDRA